MVSTCPHPPQKGLPRSGLTATGRKEGGEKREQKEWEKKIKKEIWIMDMNNKLKELVTKENKGSERQEQVGKTKRKQEEEEKRERCDGRKQKINTIKGSRQ